MRNEMLKGAMLVALVVMLPACETGRSESDQDNASSANALVTNANTADNAATRIRIM